MDLNQELRQLRIALVTDTPHPYLEMALWFFELWKNLYITKKQKKTIFHHTSKTSDWAFFIEDDSDKLWCSLKSYAEVVCIKFGVTRSEINDITHVMVLLLLEQTTDERIKAIGEVNHCNVCRHITYEYILE